MRDFKLEEGIGDVAAGVFSRQRCFFPRLQLILVAYLVNDSSAFTILEELILRVSKGRHQYGEARNLCVLRLPGV